MNVCTAMTALIHEAGFNAPRMYSGRNMYGRQCLGISADDSGMVVGYKLGEALSRVSEEVRNTLMDLGDHIACARTEALGHSAIHYFPSIPWEPEEKEDEDAFLVIINYGRGHQELWPSTNEPQLYSEEEASAIVERAEGAQTAFNAPPGRGHPAYHYKHITEATEFVSGAAFSQAEKLLDDYQDPQ